jgi:hypothetical protein
MSVCSAVPSLPGHRISVLQCRQLAYSTGFPPDTPPPQLIA